MIRGELLEAAASIRAAAAEAAPELANLPIAAIGWATVDHERAMDELGAALGANAGPGAASSPWRELPRDASLGASARVRQDPGNAPALVVLEPDTEGLLAASLVRFGEGVAVIYLGSAAVDRTGLAGRLVRGGRPWGPHVVVLGEATA